MTKVKFCGITNERDAQDALRISADFIGFITEIKGARRALPFEKIERIISSLKPKNNQRIVFVVSDPNAKIMLNILELTKNDRNRYVIQFHGNENPEELKLIKEKTGMEIWKALSVNETDIEKKVLKYSSSADRILLDTKTVEEKVRGEKRTFDAFDLFKKLQKKHNLILSGGLTPENIEGFLKKLNLEIVDVSSGVESEVGKKDKDKMKQFLQQMTDV
jgi:phosphoribosylanthranilate isomerase